MKQYKKALIKHYDAFSLAVDFDRRTLIQKEILDILNKVEKPDSEDFYIKGLTFYFIDENNAKTFNRKIALEEFLKAYELDNTNFLACLYIAHCYHDQCDHAKALEYYKAVDQKSLKAFQLWRYIKLLEQIGYCYYKLGYEELGHNKFEEVLNWYRKLGSEELAMPTEIIECLDSSHPITIELRKLLNS